MSTQFEKKPEFEKKENTIEQPSTGNWDNDDHNKWDDLTIKVSVEKQKFILRGSDLGIDLDTATDRQKLQAIQRALEEQGKKFHLLGHEIHPTNDTTWMVAPEASFGG
jgi:hypothetical protein